MNRFILSITALCACMSVAAMDPGQAPGSPRRKPVKQNNTRIILPSRKNYSPHDAFRRENFNLNAPYAHGAFHEAASQIMYTGIVHDANPPAANQN